MTEQPGLFEPPSLPMPPINGRTARTRRCSASGARKASEGRTTKIARLRALWRQPHTMQDVAAILQIPLTSVCSLKATLDRELVEVDQVERFWPDGRVTLRTRWQLVTAAK